MPDFPFSLYLITDRHQTGNRLLSEVVEQALAGGVRAVQLREKDLSARELYSVAQTLREITKRYDAYFFINDRIDVALAVDADGVHLGVQSLPPQIARKLVGPHKLIGASTHSLREVQAAVEGGVDFVVFGPVFFTPSKAKYGTPVGLEALRAIRAHTTLPLYAIGGISQENVAQIASLGVDGIAVISAVIAAPHPNRAAQNLIQAFTEVRPKSV